jgi:uncharacterized membrane protein
MTPFLEEEKLNLKEYPMQTDNTLVDFVDKQDWLEDISRSTQKTIQNATQKKGTAGNSLKKALHGNLLGYPLHPILNDIPIGAWTVSTVLDTMNMASGRRSFEKGANGAAAVGITGALTAALAGFADWSYTSGHVRRVGMFHALLNTVVMLIFGASLMTGRRHGLRRFLRLTGLTALGVSGYLGNHIAYRKGAATKYSPLYESPEEIVPEIIER